MVHICCMCVACIGLYWIYNWHQGRILLEKPANGFKRQIVNEREREGTQEGKSERKNEKRKGKKKCCLLASLYRPVSAKMKQIH
mgnify:CR=1 FL=1